MGGQPRAPVGRAIEEGNLPLGFLIAFFGGLLFFVGVSLAGKPATKRGALWGVVGHFAVLGLILALR